MRYQCCDQGNVIFRLISVLENAFLATFIDRENAEKTGKDVDKREELDQEITYARIKPMWSQWVFNGRCLGPEGIYRLFCNHFWEKSVEFGRCF